MVAQQHTSKFIALGLATTLALGSVPVSALPARADTPDNTDLTFAVQETLLTTSEATAGDVATEPEIRPQVDTDPVQEPEVEPAPEPEPEQKPDPDPDPNAKPNPEPEKPAFPALKAGWNKTGGKWYWGDSNGKPRTGWLKTGGSWYWLDPTANGRMATGWAQVDGHWYYLNGSGAMQTGWLKRGSWYYLNANGAMATGWKRVSGTWYYLNPSTGAMKTGWAQVDGHWYYLSGSGAMQTGWLKRGSWYYLNANGAMATGWKRVSGMWYYLNPSTGAMKTGWLDLDGTWYYLDGSGAMVTGSRTINGRTSIFNSSGQWQGYDKVEQLFTKWAQSESSSTKWLILVDTKRCKVGVFWGSKGNWQLQRMMDCAPGKSSTPTKKGRFTVGSKGYYFDSGSARCFYFTQFSGNYLFHSVLYYQTSRPTSVMDGRVGMGLSHGCVRLQLSNAKWIYDNIPRGTKVYVW